MAHQARARTRPASAAPKKRPGSVSDRFDLLVPTSDPGNLALAVRDQAALILAEPFGGGHRERLLASQLWSIEQHAEQGRAAGVRFRPKA